MVIVDLQGRLLSGTRIVTSEVCMHLVVYEMRKDILAVIHSHPPIATGFACAGRGLDQVLCQEGVMTLGAVPLAEYATTGTDEVAASLRPFICGHEAILMANHGAVTYGSGLLEAFLRMETVEHLAHIELVTHQLGSPRPLSVNQIEQVRLAKARYLQNVNIPNSLKH
jgi:L-fuculose-phosphate aldolase